MQRDASIHADLLAQVASSEYEAREVRRILGAPLTGAELTRHNARRLAAVERVIIGAQLRRNGTHGDRFARGLSRTEPNACGIAGPVVTPCSGVGRLVQALRRWLRGVR